MARLGRIPVTISSITVGGMGVKNVQVSRKQTQKIHKFADGSRDRSEGQPEYTFSLLQRRGGSAMTPRVVTPYPSF